MKRCLWIVEVRGRDGWAVIAKTDREGSAALIADALAQRIPEGAARYGKTTGAGRVHLYRRAA